MFPPPGVMVLIHSRAIAEPDLRVNFAKSTDRVYIANFAELPLRPGATEKMVCAAREVARALKFELFTFPGPVHTHRVPVGLLRPQEEFTVLGSEFDKTPTAFELDEPAMLEMCKDVRVSIIAR